MSQQPTPPRKEIVLGSYDPTTNTHYMEIQKYIAEHGGVPPQLYDADRSIRGSVNLKVIFQAK